MSCVADIEWETPGTITLSACRMMKHWESSSNAYSFLVGKRLVVDIYLAFSIPFLVTRKYPKISWSGSRYKSYYLISGFRTSYIDCWLSLPCTWGNFRDLELRCYIRVPLHIFMVLNYKSIKEKSSCWILNLSPLCIYSIYNIFISLLIDYINDLYLKNMPDS